MTAIKKDEEKSRIDLVDPDFLETVGQVLGFGARKYSSHNWRGGFQFSRLIAAAYRHLGAINSGEDIDQESGLPHTGHLACCVMFLDWMVKNRPDLDDRYISRTSAGDEPELAVEVGSSTHNNVERRIFKHLQEELISTILPERPF